jgi:hypothetical protein
MHVVNCVLVLATLFELNWAELKSCLEDQNQPTICFKAMNGENGYVVPFPVVLDTLIDLKEIVDIDEDEKSITAQLLFSIFWKDSQIYRSNGTLK